MKLGWPVVFPKALPWAQKLAVPKVWAEHPCPQKKHHQPEFWELSQNWIRRDLKDDFSNNTISRWQGFLSGKLTAPTAFAWRAEDGDAQQMQDHNWAEPGWLFPNSIRETLGKRFRATFLHHKMSLYERQAQSCFIFPLLGYKQKKHLEMWPGLYLLQTWGFRCQILHPTFWLRVTMLSVTFLDKTTTPTSTQGC